MKKVLLLLVTFVSVIYVSAQEVNSSQSQSAPISIDSLSIKLNEIQHNYDFMYCDYELHKLIMDLKDLAHSIDNSSNGVLINVYNSRFVRIMTSEFTEKELNVLTASLDVVSKATMKVESSLNYYNVAIQAYRDKI